MIKPVNILCEVERNPHFASSKTRTLTVFVHPNILFQLDPNGNTSEPIEDRQKASPSKETENPEGVWSITLEQFLATMLADESIEEFFNEKVSLMPQLEALRQRDRLQSVS